MKDLDERLLAKIFPTLKDQRLAQEIINRGSLLELPADTVILKTNQPIEEIPLVVEGAVKVVKEYDDLREVLLYFIRPGETCAMTLSSCIRKNRSAIKARTISHTSIITLAVNTVFALMKQFSSWNEFVIDSYQTRFDLMVEAYEIRSFMSIDQQILQYLTSLQSLDQTEKVQITHREIASDLATSRVVVSRALKTLEEQGLVRLGRNEIRLL